MALNSSYALIGAKGVSSNRGDAYLYNLGTSVWTDLAGTSNSPVTGLPASSYFGTSVALNSGYALIGASWVSSNRGDAYLYNLGTGDWTDLAATSGQPVTGLTGTASFGSSVALNDSYALIGANGVSSNRGDAYLYNLGTGVWTDLAGTSGTPVTGLTGTSSYFGISVALNSSYALIGARGVSSIRGDAYLYNLGTGVWTDLAATSGQPVTGLTSDSYFGTSVALNDSYALIGAYRGVEQSWRCVPVQPGHERLDRSGWDQRHAGDWTDGYYSIFWLFRGSEQQLRPDRGAEGCRAFVAMRTCTTWARASGPIWLRPAARR